MRDYIDPAYKTIMYSQGGTPPPGFGGEPERRQNIQEIPSSIPRPHRSGIRKLLNRRR